MLGLRACWGRFTWRLIGLRSQKRNFLSLIITGWMSWNGAVQLLAGCFDTASLARAAPVRPCSAALCGVALLSERAWDTSAVVTGKGLEHHQPPELRQSRVPGWLAEGVAIGTFSFVGQV